MMPSGWMQVSEDAYYVASQLAAVVKGGDFGAVLCGIESSDYNGSAVGGMLAEILGYSFGFGCFRP